MTTQEAVTLIKGPPRIVGHVYTPVRITNNSDLVLAAHGVVSERDIRSIELEEMLVDTGASHLCLPADLIEQLGLELKEVIQVTTADGDRTTRLFEGAYLEVAGRSAIVRCIETRVGTSPLLGVVPMEDLTLEPDIINHVLRVLPRHGKDTRILLY
jgi:predicted aspartyl protease